MVVEYKADGTITRELLPRKMFPFHASDTKEDAWIGSPAMGYDSGTLWIWLPGSTDLITISTEDGKTAVMNTQLPKKVGHREVPLTILRGRSGDVVAQIREDGDHGESGLAYYTWSPTTKSWGRFKPDACDGDSLVGTRGSVQMYIQRENSGTSLCLFGQ